MNHQLPQFTLVVPVYNEAANIGRFCRDAVQMLTGQYEVLVCYDFEEDSTLPAIEALPAQERPAQLRLIRNRLGCGVRYAIEAGMRAASGPVVVVMMADMSDDFSLVPQMVARAEAGAAVVCASRYMAGGRQIGGPWLKGMLSRTAGVTLYWLAGVGTHDSTNSFKAYRRDFLDCTPIESSAGFALGMELTLKAHFAGLHVEELPATWRDRSAGSSRFRLWKWLPLYLGWYVWALKQRAGRAFLSGRSARHSARTNTAPAGSKKAA